ncbi:MAG: hypothetical protein Q8P41_31885 [Pseudomonadota bacterium]|nr:hypothetical protein [Pseudomonadota bacterium]
MRRLLRPRPETILRKLNLQIRKVQAGLARAQRQDRLAESAVWRAELTALQLFREKAFGLRLRSYNANKTLFPKGDRKP